MDKEKLKKLRAEYLEKDTRLKALLDQESLSAEEQEEALQLDSECEQLKADIEAEQSNRKKVAELRTRASAREDWAGATAGTLGGAGTGVPLGNAGRGGPQAGREDIPANVRSGRHSSFKSTEKKTAQLRAYQFGMWFLATSLSNSRARRYCQENGIPLQAVLGGETDRVVQLGQVEGVNASGGYLVPEEFENDLIDLREKFGLFRQFAKNVPMRSDTKSRPRRTGGLTAYPVGEGQTISQSQKGWDRVGLTARKWAVLAKYSSELDEDAVIDIGNDLAEEISYAFALAEDDCGWNGDGTGTYHRIQGVLHKLKNLHGTVGYIAGLVEASGNAWDEITLPNFNQVVARLPQYADNENTAWYCHKTFYHGVMEKLALAAGGVTAREVEEGAHRGNPVFLGYPVRISQKLPRFEANSQIPVVFGDLKKGVMFGDRRMTTIAISEHAAFEEDEMMIRGTERFDINVHDVGNADATAANREPGPIVGMITAAG